ncbi:MAG: DUF6152 family protein [Daejeonella sp.]|uniref:DUF6152 family protein n=1 Tax=Daejeonella sp. JGW-45 TaxID=3034148 RepID=UPI0023EBB859|nr:DUF6152 family protein [Daejeonella sp. JGW-45]
MAYLRNLSLAGVLLLATAFTFFHHGWAEYDQTRAIDYKATIEKLVWENPHALATVKYKGASTTVYLAPTTRMNDRGLSPEMVKEGTAVRLVAYPHKSGKNEMRAERIYVGDKKYELR